MSNLLINLLKENPFTGVEPSPENFNQPRINYVIGQINQAIGGIDLKNVQIDPPTDAMKEFFNIGRASIEDLLGDCTDTEAGYIVTYLGMTAGVFSANYIEMKQNESTKIDWLPDPENVTCCLPHLLSNQHSHTHKFVDAMEGMIDDIAREWMDQFDMSKDPILYTWIYTQIYKRFALSTGAEPPEAIKRLYYYLIGSTITKTEIQIEGMQANRRLAQTELLEAMISEPADAEILKLKYDIYTLLPQRIAEEDQKSHDLLANADVQYGFEPGRSKLFANIIVAGTTQITEAYVRDFNMQKNPEPPTINSYSSRCVDLLAQHFPRLTVAEAIFCQSTITTSVMNAYNRLRAGTGNFGRGIDINSLLGGGGI